jgi:hypothetical protein
MAEHLFILENGKQVQVEISLQKQGGIILSQRVIDSTGKFLTHTCTLTCNSGKTISWDCQDGQSCYGDCSDENNPKGYCQ